MSENIFFDLLTTVFRRNGLEGMLTDERAAKLYTLTAHMSAVNEQFNLTAIKEPNRIVLLHYADSLKGAEVFPEGGRVIDVGCGAGFPSLPLAIFRPDLKIIAIDSTAKRVGYVAETAKLLGLPNVSALTARAEELSRDNLFRESFDCATARAVASLPILCELCLPFVKVGGIFAAMKGKSAADELSAAQKAIQTLGGGEPVLYDTPLSDGEDSFAHATVVIPKVSKTPREYPRLYTKIAKAPL